MHQKFLQLKHSIQKQIRHSYWIYISDLITPRPEDRTSTSQKKFWSFIKSLRKDSCSIQTLKVNSKVITNNKEKAEVLNSHFQSIFTVEPNELPPEKESSPYAPMTNINITTPGIFNLLKYLNIYKASGPDQISTRFLKETAEVVAPILKIIFETSLHSGEVPHNWKVANVTPIFKKENAVYHKITVLSHSLVLLVKF